MIAGGRGVMLNSSVVSLDDTIGQTDIMPCSRWTAES